MEEILISVLSTLGLGINGVINGYTLKAGENFADKLNKFTKNKFSFCLVSSKNGVYTFSTNNGKLFIYTTNENGGIIDIKIEDKRL